MLKIIASVVFVAYGVIAGVAVNDLFGVWSILFAVAVTCGLLWEIWIQPVRDERYRQKLLADIEGMRFTPIESPKNVSDCQDVVIDLKERLEVVTDAYVETVARLAIANDYVDLKEQEAPDEV